MKLIARVVNVEEWAKEGPLSGAEHSLLNNYNDKPILTRPQQKFFTGKHYLEIDLDVHTYAWLARKALAGFIPRLGEHNYPFALMSRQASPISLFCTFSDHNLEILYGREFFYPGNWECL